MFITGKTVCLTEWIIDDTCLVFYIFNYEHKYIHFLVTPLMKEK